MAKPRPLTYVIVPGTVQPALCFWTYSKMSPIVLAESLKSPQENANTLDKITQAMSPPVTSKTKSVLKEQRYRYGIRSMEILATNNHTDSCLFPKVSGSTFSIQKKIDTIQNSEFAHVFDAKIRHPIEVLLHSSLPAPCGLILLPLRMGFQEAQLANPMIVHLLVDQDSLSDNSACKLVEKIARIISAEWQGEEIVYIDLCRKINEPELRDDNTGGIQLYDQFSELYLFPFPPPGFSIGPKDSPKCSGSFTGFIKHGNEAYGLTCEHVVNPVIEVKKPHATGRDNDNSESWILRLVNWVFTKLLAAAIKPRKKRMLGSDEPYKYKDGEAKVGVTMPAVADHAKTIKEIRDRVDKACEQNPINAEVAAYFSKTYQFQAASRAVEKAFLDTVKEKADEYDCNIGHLYATSGFDRSGTLYEGRIDWAIHHKRSFFDNYSGFRLDTEDRDYVNTKINPNFYQEAAQYVDNYPQFKSLRTDNPEPDEIFFKLASRTSNLKVARYNEIKASIRGTGIGTITRREMCFITPSRLDHVSQKGDSGAPVIDAKFKPYGMVWGGEVGYPDVTFVTPIHVILKHIELQMGWKAGSIGYC